MQQNKKNFDSQLQTYFGEIKRTIKEEHITYLKNHPQLRQILNDFLSSCLLEQPQDVYQYAKKFFSFFNYQKDNVKYNPLIISGCSGVGKGTLINMLLKNYPDIFQLSISYTTRRPRQGQVHGREYYFVKKQQFENEIAKDVFAQYCEVHDNYYGTHKGKLFDIINRGKICLLDIDLQGGEKIHNNLPNCNFLFINAPSFEVLQSRLKKRGTQTQEVIQKRLKNAHGQVEKIKELTFYNTIINDQLNKSYQEILKFIKSKYENLHL